MKGARFTLAAAFLLVASSVFAQANITGDWDVTITGPQGPNTSRVSFKETDGKVSGVFKSPMGERPFEGGSRTGNDLKFSFSIDLQGQSLLISMNGKVDGASIAGQADFGGFATGDWTAKRADTSTADAPAPAAAPAEVAAPDAPAATDAPAAMAGGGPDGTWDVLLQTPQGDFPASATLKVEAGKLTGTFGSQMGEVPLAGTVEGTTLKFTLTAQTPQGDMTVAMTGELNGDAIVNGKADISGLGQLDWTAKRAKK